MRILALVVGALATVAATKDVASQSSVNGTSKVLRSPLVENRIVYDGLPVPDTRTAALFAVTYLLGKLHEPLVFAPILSGTAGEAIEGIADKGDAIWEVRLFYKRTEKLACVLLVNAKTGATKMTKTQLDSKTDCGLGRRK